LACSADGRRIGYERPRGAGSDIWIADADTGNTENLTRAPKSEGFFVWAPDTRRIAVTCSFYNCTRPKGILDGHSNRRRNGRLAGSA
jgi:Tol biopolymer transport system component